MASRYETLSAPAEGVADVHDEDSDGVLGGDDGDAWQPWHPATAGALC